MDLALKLKWVDRIEVYALYLEELAEIFQPAPERGGKIRIFTQRRPGQSPWRPSIKRRAVVLEIARVSEFKISSRIGTGYPAPKFTGLHQFDQGRCNHPAM